MPVNSNIGLKIIFNNLYTVNWINKALEVNLSVSLNKDIL